MGNHTLMNVEIWAQRTFSGAMNSPAKSHVGRTSDSMTKQTLKNPAMDSLIFLSTIMLLKVVSAKKDTSETVKSANERIVAHQTIKTAIFGMINSQICLE